MGQENLPVNENRINPRIDEILECGFRYAKYKLCLKRNRIKADPKALDWQYLLKRLKEEVAELEESLSHNCIEVEKIALECGDIINFASMICDKTEQP